jgi:hypothetical protein
MSASTTVSNESRILNAGQWLLDSGIQNNDKGSLAFGGVNAWYDLLHDEYPFIYGEITGYAINSYLHFHQLTGDEAYLAAARKAAGWIIANRIQPSGLVLNRLNHIEVLTPYFKEWFFTFDQWMIVYGLAELHSVTKDLLYLQHAEEIALFLIENTVSEAGAFYPIFDQETQKAFEQDDKWSRQSGGFHAKGLMGLLKLYDLTQKEIYLTTAKSLQEWTLDSQQNTGRFVTQDNERSSHLHPYLYTLEGLLYFAIHESCEKTLNAVEKSAKWILDYQNQRGGFSAYFVKNEFLPYERVDINAQFLRVAAILSSCGRLKDETDKLAKVARYLENYQILSGNQKGGFFYGQEETGQMHYCVNAWVTMFAAQALSYYESVKSSQAFDMTFFV